MLPSFRLLLLDDGADLDGCKTCVATALQEERGPQIQKASWGLGVALGGGFEVILFVEAAPISPHQKKPRKVAVPLNVQGFCVASGPWNHCSCRLRLWVLPRSLEVYSIFPASSSRPHPNVTELCRRLV